jgi:hypothetical protein
MDANMNMDNIGQHVSDVVAEYDRARRERADKTKASLARNRK